MKSLSIYIIIYKLKPFYVGFNLLICCVIKYFSYFSKTYQIVNSNYKGNNN